MKFNFLAIFVSNLRFIWLPFGNDKISPSFWGTFAHFTLIIFFILGPLQLRTRGHFHSLYPLWACTLDQYSLSKK
jgi:hypothetical protein